MKRRQGRNDFSGRTGGAECQFSGLLQGALLQAPRNGVPSGCSARFICGSARDLEVEVKAGRLREDLYYRISGVCLRLPPLRQRKEDIPFLMGHFLRKYARRVSPPGSGLERRDAASFSRIIRGREICGNWKMRPGCWWRWEMSTWPWADCARCCTSQPPGQRRRNFVESGVAERHRTRRRRN